MTTSNQFKLKILIIAIIFAYSDCLLKENLKKIKEKAKKLYKNKFGKDKTWQFLGYDVTEYPGINDKYRKINQDRWDEYYGCLHERNTNIGKHGSVIPEAKLGFEGGSIKFQCKVCVSPEESTNKDLITWEWAGLNSKELEPVEYTEHILSSPEDQSLQIYNLQDEHTGQYMCKLGETLTAPYFLTVANSSTNMSEVHSLNTPHGPYPTTTQNIEEYGLRLNTEWGNWSTCSKCDQVGRKHKLGYCNVVFENALEETPSTLNSTTTSSTLLNTSAENTTEQNVTDAEIDLLKIFKYGIPCDSHILPKSVKNLELIKNRLNEVMTGYCQEHCQGDKIFAVKDKDGNIIEKANNSAGIYSLLQGVPPVEPEVERRLQYENWGEYIILSCPGNINSDAPIQWQIGGKNIVPELISRETKGRMFVSMMDKILIKKAKLSDSDTYSCWQHKELAGTIRLVVEKKVRMNFNHHIMLFGVVIILSTFLYVFVRAFLGRKHAKIIN